MCGRFVLLTDLSIIAESFHIRRVTCEYRPDDNISPGRQVAAVICMDDENSLVSFRWGLIPSWARDPSIGNRMFNARSETVTVKPSFRNAFKKRRCLIVADGFYEWQKHGKGRKPFLFRLKSGNPFGFAGLHESWISPDKREINTCTIITTESNGLISSIHDRMPVIILNKDEAAWLDPEYANPNELLRFLRPYPAGEMEMKEARIGSNDLE